MYDVYLRPETTSVDVTDPSPTHDILNSMGETPQEVKQLLTNFGIPKVQAKAFRSTWADADLGATADSDEYWRLELRDMYKAAIFMGLEMAKVRDLMKKKGGDLGSIKTNVGLEKMQYFGRHLMIPQLLIAER